MDLYLPAFQSRQRLKLAPDLSRLGMGTAFTRKADFTAMRPIARDKDENLYIGAVVHEAFVDVNEEGTEAAAATAVVMEASETKAPRTLVFRADHPFLYFIQHRPTGTILFMGRLVNPLAS